MSWKLKKSWHEGFWTARRAWKGGLQGRTYLYHILKGVPSPGAFIITFGTSALGGGIVLRFGLHGSLPLYKWDPCLEISCEKATHNHCYILLDSDLRIFSSLKQKNKNVNFMLHKNNEVLLMIWSMNRRVSIVFLREILFTKDMPGSKLNLPQISSMVLCGKQCKFQINVTKLSNFPSKSGVLDGFVERL